MLRPGLFFLRFAQAERFNDSEHVFSLKGAPLISKPETVSWDLWIAESISAESAIQLFGKLPNRIPRDIISFRHRIALSALDSWMIESLGALPQAEACAAALALDIDLHRTCAAFVPRLHILPFSY